MNVKIIAITIFLLASCALQNCALFSSFWAPLYDPRILNYRVDAKFDPDAGKTTRDEYQGKYGVRGQRLIGDLGSGRKNGANGDKAKDNGVRFYYTYRGLNGME